MPSRKQKRRQAKDKRHEHEFVWVDSQGNPLEEQPEDPAPASKQRNGTAPATQQKGKAQPQKGGRTARVPQPPSWPRAAKRAAILGVVVFVIFSFGASRSHHGYITAIIPAVIYTALFVPFTYVIDRYAYNRYLAKTQQGGAAPKKQPPKKN
jgi:hypothetical protein